MSRIDSIYQRVLHNGKLWKGDSECHLWSFKEPAENESLGADYEPINCTNPILRYGSHTEVVSWYGKIC